VVIQEIPSLHVKIAQFNAGMHNLLHVVAISVFVQLLKLSASILNDETHVVHRKNLDASFPPQSHIDQKITLSSSKKVMWLCSHLDADVLRCNAFFRYSQCFRLFFKDSDNSEEESLVDDLWRRLHFFGLFSSVSFWFDVKQHTRDAGLLRLWASIS